jgi:hypothetical protein
VEGLLALRDFAWVRLQEKSTSLRFIYISAETLPPAGIPAFRYSDPDAVRRDAMHRV